MPSVKRRSPSRPSEAPILWHVAAALALAGKRGRKALTFCSLDVAQGDVARALGFAVTPP